MGAMTFLLPPALSPDLTSELERACVCGGPDNMPWPTEVRVEPGRLTVRRDVDESGVLAVPWDVEGAGRVMGTTATLIEQALPYQFRLELARGKVNQIRCQAADWQAGGLHLPASLFEQIRNHERGIRPRRDTAPCGNQSASADGTHAGIPNGRGAGDALCVADVRCPPPAAASTGCDPRLPLWGGRRSRTLRPFCRHQCAVAGFHVEGSRAGGSELLLGALRGAVEARARIGRGPSGRVR